MELDSEICHLSSGIFLIFLSLQCINLSWCFIKKFGA